MELTANEEVRVIVLNGQGNVFCAGFDLNEIGAMLSGLEAKDRLFLSEKISRMQRALTRLAQCPKPVIAAVYGPCIGGGVDLLCCCDVRVAHKKAFFSVRETRMAMVADLGTIQRLPAIVGPAWARELILTGRDFSAQKALEIGFITHLAETRDDLEAKAHELASEIAANAPLAVQESKKLMNYSEQHGLQAGLSHIAQKNAVLLYSNDVREAYEAFLQKRKPEFSGT
jgi:enoyl-CoA hydratase